MSKEFEDELEEEFKALELNAESINIEDKTEVVDDKHDDVLDNADINEVEELKMQLKEAHKKYGNILKIKIEYDGIIQKQMRMIEYMGEKIKYYGLDMI